MEKLLEYHSYRIEQIPWGESDSKKRKIKGIARAVNDTCNTMYNLELIVKEIKHTNNNRKFRDATSLEERLSIARIFKVF